MFGCSQNTMQKLKRKTYHYITAMLSLVQMFFVPFFLGVAGVGGGGVLEGREDNVSLL